jgi:hypothetical protein
MASGLPCGEAIAKIELSRFTHVLTICMHMHGVNLDGNVPFGSLACIYVSASAELNLADRQFSSPSRQCTFRNLNALDRKW